MRGAHGGHAHNDCLSFEAFCQGESFITDSGTYVYSADPALRNLFKSTESHNTVRVDGEEINRFSPQALFGMQNDAAPRVRAWRSTQAEDFLDAEHYGYRRLPDPVVHRRSYLLERERGMLLITDELEGTGRHLFEIFLHFSPGVSLLPMGEGIYQARKGAAAVLLYFPDLEAGWQLSTRECWISERYGRKERGVSIVATARREPPALFRSMVDLNPWTGEAAPQTRALREAAESLSLRKR
jgi:hypothetical protein